MRVAYTGHEALTFPDYINLATGRTLRAEPGGRYDIAPASGRMVPEVPQPWFTAVQWEPAPFIPVALRPAEPDAAPEPEAEPGGEPEPGGEGEQDHPEG